MALQEKRGRRVADHLRLVVDPGEVAGLPVVAFDDVAECATISAAILHAPARNTAIVRGLRPEHFFDLTRARVWEAIAALGETEADAPLDVVLLARWLRDRGGAAPDGGWAAYLGPLIDATPNVQNVGRHVDVVLELAEVRRVAATCQVIVAETYAAMSDRREWLRTAPERVAACVTATAAPTCEDANTILGRYFAELQAAGEDREEGEIAGYSTGLPTLDKRLGGLVPTDLLVLTGREKEGKSALGAQMCASVARRPRRMRTGAPGCTSCEPQKPCQRHEWQWYGALIFQGEGDRETTIARLAGARARVDLSRVRTGGLTHEDFDKLLAAGNDLRRFALKVDDEHTQSVAGIAARVRAVRDEWAARGIVLAVVMIDSLQLLAEEGRTREEELDRATRKIVALKKSKDLRNVAWILVNHTTAEGEMTHSRAPRKWCDTWLHLEVSGREDEDPTLGSRPASLKVRLSRHTEAGESIPLWVWRRYNNLFQDGG